MSIGRISSLNNEELRQLKKIMTPLWKAKDGEGNYKYTGIQIAELLGFGEEGSFQKLSPESVYYWRQVLGLPTRREYRGYPQRYKYGKQEEPLDLTDWVKKIDEIPLTSYHNRRKRTYCELDFWSGLRNREISLLTRNDFTLEGKSLLIDAFRLKKKVKRREEAIYPLELRLNWIFVEEIWDWVKRFKADEHPWNVHRSTAWTWVKQIMPKAYPHYFRENRITALCSDPRFSIAEIRAWTGLHLITINYYISKSKRFVTSVAEKMDEDMRKQK